jgi:hypothetical protein
MKNKAAKINLNYDKNKNTGPMLRIKYLKFNKQEQLGVDQLASVSLVVLKATS